MASECKNRRGGGEGDGAGAGGGGDTCARQTARNAPRGFCLLLKVHEDVWTVFRICSTDVGCKRPLKRRSHAKKEERLGRGCAVCYSVPLTRQPPTSRGQPCGNPAIPACRIQHPLRRAAPGSRGKHEKKKKKSGARTKPPENHFRNLESYVMGCWPWFSPSWHFGAFTWG